MIDTITVGSTTPDERKKKLSKCYDYHSKALQELGAGEKDFQVKIPFMISGGVKVVGIWASEFKKDKGLYIEFVDKNYEPEDPKRKLYNMPPIENYEHVYNLLPKGAYAVPIEDLEPVSSIIISAIAKGYNADISKEMESMDENIDKLTIKDLAAILLKNPVSDKAWLNKIINDTKY